MDEIVLFLEESLSSFFVGGVLFFLMVMGKRWSTVNQRGGVFIYKFPSPALSLSSPLPFLPIVLRSTTLPLAAFALKLFLSLLFLSALGCLLLAVRDGKPIRDENGEGIKSALTRWEEFCSQSEREGQNVSPEEATT